MKYELRGKQTAAACYGHCNNCYLCKEKRLGLLIADLKPNLSENATVSYSFSINVSSLYNYCVNIKKYKLLILYNQYKIVDYFIINQ